MKLKLLSACAMLAIAIASCGDADTDHDDTDRGDTAVLVEDPKNTLDADPINDTTVVVTDTTHIH